MGPWNRDEEAVLDATSRRDALVALLRSDRNPTMTELAAELGVSVRTIRRDVAALRMRGMDIEGERGRGGGIRFARFAPLPPLHLEETEAVGLWISVQLARHAAGIPYSRGSQAGLNKVLAALPEKRRRNLRRLSERIFVGAPASASVRASMGETVPTLLDAFERCFGDEVCLGFDYQDRKGNRTRRRIEPHGIFVDIPVWYILAIDLDKDAARMFRMDRITNPRALRQGFAPSGAVLDAFLKDLQFGFGGARPLA